MCTCVYKHVKGVFTPNFKPNILLYIQTTHNHEILFFIAFTSSDFVLSPYFKMMELTNMAFQTNVTYYCLELATYI